ncbi:MAG: molybdopterin-dependent oxidoreductase [Negativicutes bacterium]|nr:molybdopterin-dependent oxidoreductase [Negativicutes bacterium]
MKIDTRRGHQALGAGLLLLAVSGGLLYLPSLRGALADVRWLLRDIHIMLGLAFTASLLANVPFLTRHLASPAGNSGQWLKALLLATAAGLIVSGGYQTLFWLGWAESATAMNEAHRWLAALGVILALIHLAWQRTADTPGGVVSLPPAEAGEGRRLFIKKLLALGVLFGAGAGLKWWQLLVNQAGNEPDPIPGGFKDCNRLTPPPAPAAQSLPPAGGGYQGQFRSYTITKKPCATNENWTFRISGLVDKPQAYRWEDFVRLPRTVQVSDFHCVEGWSVKRVTYEGIPLARLLDEAGVGAGARFVKFISGDGVYTDSLSLDQARMSDVMVAMLLDGNPIPSDLGGPAKLVVPRMYAYKSVKWLVGIELIAGPHAGYWEERGYPADAWVEGNPPKG